MSAGGKYIRWATSHNPISKESSRRYSCNVSNATWLMKRKLNHIDHRYLLYKTRNHSCRQRKAISINFLLRLWIYVMWLCFLCRREFWSCHIHVPVALDAESSRTNILRKLRLNHQIENEKEGKIHPQSKIAGSCPCMRRYWCLMLLP